jgi:hypothetical protein
LFLDNKQERSAMEKPRLTLEFCYFDAAIVCSDPHCDDWADVGLSTNKSSSRKRAFCPAHASLALQGWIKRERERARLEKLRVEFHSGLHKDEQDG